MSGIIGIGRDHPYSLAGSSLPNFTREVGELENSTPLLLLSAARYGNPEIPSFSSHSAAAAGLALTSLCRTFLNRSPSPDSPPHPFLDSTVSVYRVLASFDRFRCFHPAAMSAPIATQSISRVNNEPNCEIYRTLWLLWSLRYF